MPSGDFFYPKCRALPLTLLQHKMMSYLKLSLGLNIKVAFTTLLKQENKYLSKYGLYQ